MPTELADGLWWLTDCYALPESGRHLQFSTYLVTGDEGTVLVDTGPFTAREAIVAQVEDVVDLAAVDAVVVSASDYVHGGNLSVFEDHPDVDVYAGGNPDIHGYAAYENFTRIAVGDVIDLAGTCLEVLDPVLHDVASTTWLYDERSRALFTSDSFGFYHAPGECEALGAGVDRGAVTDFHADTLRWLPYVDPERILEEVAYVLDAYDVEYLLPAHGRPITGPDVAAFRDTFADAIRDVVAAGRA